MNLEHIDNDISEGRAVIEEIFDAADRDEYSDADLAKVDMLWRAVEKLRAEHGARRAERERHAAKLIEEFRPMDDEIGAERFAAVQRAMGFGREHFITTLGSLAEALAYHSGTVLDGWEALAVVDLDTGERFEVEVADPRVTVKPQAE